MVVIMALDISGIIYDTANNNALNDKVNETEKEIAVINEKLSVNISDNSKNQSQLTDYFKKVEIDNDTLSCLSNKKYWQYQDCFYSIK